MNKLRLSVRSFIPVGVIVVMGLFLWSFAGCNEDPPASLYDPNYVSGSQPVVSTMDPPSGLAGVTTVTITGSNFSTVPGANLVFFDAMPATVLEASAAQLKVRAPNLVKDSILVKIAVAGADLFSVPYLYALNAAVEEWGEFGAFDEPAGMTCDSSGNLYVSMLTSGIGVGVKRIALDGSQTDYSPAFSSGVPRWTGMKFGSGGDLYTVALRNIIFLIPAGGGSNTLWLRGGGLGNIADLDFDTQGNIWTAGTADNVYGVKPDKSVKAFPFDATVRTVRVFNNYLYLGGGRDSAEAVWRMQIISADSLGAEELYFDFSAAYGYNGPKVLAINFAADGDMYIGTDDDDAIVVVHPGGSSEPLYPGLFIPQTSALAWGNGVHQYAGRTGTSDANTPLKVNMEKLGAPYNGWTLP